MSRSFDWFWCDSRVDQNIAAFVSRSRPVRCGRPNEKPEPRAEVVSVRSSKSLSTAMAFACMRARLSLERSFALVRSFSAKAEVVAPKRDLTLEIQAAIKEAKVCATR
jgi:hypothetical protein